MGKKGGGKSKLPKRVMGVKIPRQLRRGVKSLARVARQPIVGEAVTAALLAAAGALAKQGDTRGAAKAGLGAGAAGVKSAGGSKKIALAAAVAAAEAARRVMAAKEEGAKEGGKKPRPRV